MLFCGDRDWQRESYRSWALALPAWFAYMNISTRCVRWNGTYYMQCTVCLLVFVDRHVIVVSPTMYSYWHRVTPPRVAPTRVIYVPIPQLPRRGHSVMWHMEILYTIIMSTVHSLETATLTCWCLPHIPVVVDIVKTTVHPALCNRAITPYHI